MYIEHFEQILFCFFGNHPTPLRHNSACRPTLSAAGTIRTWANFLHLFSFSLHSCVTPFCWWLNIDLSDDWRSIFWRYNERRSQFETVTSRFIYSLMLFSVYIRSYSIRKTLDQPICHNRYSVFIALLFNCSSFFLWNHKINIEIRCYFWFDDLFTFIWLFFVFSCL